MTETTDTTTRRRRKTRTGVVTSDKMTKTVTVSMVRRFAHPAYGKQLTRTKTVKARDEQGAKVGDTVRIMETRPLAKTVRWRVVELVERAKEAQGRPSWSPSRDGHKARPNDAGATLVVAQ